MSFLESSAFWGIAGIVIGAIIATFFFYIGKSKKIIEYQVISTNLITKDMTNIPGISIVLDGKPIEDLVSTTIKFINSGNQTIYPNNFATLEPLGATVSGQFLNIHNYQAISDNPNSCPYVTFVNGNTVSIEFDFLKPKQSITVTLWHSGSITVLGELKSGKKQECLEVQSTSKSLLISLALFSVLNINILFRFFLSQYSGELIVDWAHVDLNSPLAVFSLVLAILFVSMFWIIPILGDSLKKQNNSRHQKLY